MAKAPKNLPERKGRCKRRGREGLGTLLKYDPERLWATVQWDEGVSAPRMVHLWELESVS